MKKNRVFLTLKLFRESVGEECNTLKILWKPPKGSPPNFASDFKEIYMNLLTSFPPEIIRKPYFFLMNLGE